MTCLRTDYCNCDTCVELRLTPEDLFQLMEDERAEFEETLKPHHGNAFDRDRNGGSYDATCDYTVHYIGIAWQTWLWARGVEWVKTP